MATEGVVITQANEDTPNIGGLFDGISFLVGLRVPMRSNFLDRIRANGGRIVRLEAQADHIIADHMRNDCPPNSLSYTFIEAAISAGALPDKNHHRAGPAPGYARTVGSTVVPPKSTRTPFTPQDDRDLWNWVQDYKNQGVHGIKGNEIYKQLEAINPRHTFQSWRDRYVKRLMANPPPGVQVQPNAAVMSTQQASSQMRPSGVDGTVENIEESQEEEAEEEELGPDVQFLLENIDDILNIPVEDLDAVWGSLADEETSSHLTADQWKRLYEEEALPAYRAKEEKAKRARASPTKRRARIATPEPIEQDTEPTTPELVAMKARAARDRQPSPSVSQKRRRETATPRSNAQPRKRARADRSAVVMDEQPTRNGAEVLGADESPTNAQNVVGLGLDGEGETQEELALPGEEPLPTSELNRAAKTQLVAEANAKNTESELPSQPILRDDNQNVETVLKPVADPASRSSVEAPEAEQAGAVSPSNVESQVAGSGADEIIPQSGLQLTEENLANQQAAHGVKVARASDLRENDEDLSSYAQYLQKLVAGHIARRTGQTQTEENRNSTDVDAENQPTRDLSPALGAQTAQATPKSAEDRQQVRTNGHNAQVSAANAEFDALLESDLPGGDQAFASQVAIDFDPFNSQDHALNTGFVPVNDAVRNWVQPATNDEPQDASCQQGFDEEMTDNVDIDLTLAEPEGGFTFSSQEDSQPNGLPDQRQWESTQPPVLDPTRVNGGLKGTLNAPNLSEDEVMEEAPAKSATPKAHAALDTQDIYATGAQQPDFSFPLPTDSDVGEDESELPADPTRKPTSAQNTTSQPALSNRKLTASATPRKLIPTSTHQEPETPETESVESFITRLIATGHAPDSIRNAIYRTSAQLQAAEVVAMYEKLGMPVPDLPEVWSDEDDAQVGTTDAKVFKALCEKKGWEEYDLRLKFLQEWRTR
ncbi:hypothetical protein MBLNU13_g00900t1 [Cladosporium sp. NU13]